MMNFDKIILEQCLDWPQIPDNPQGILIVGAFLLGQTNALLHLIKESTRN